MRRFVLALFTWLMSWLGIISIVSIGGWVFPFGLGGMHWFDGPTKTITEEEVGNGRIKGDREATIDEDAAVRNASFGHQKSVVEGTEMHAGVEVK
jgi:hypothetical protein